MKIKIKMRPLLKLGDFGIGDRVIAVRGWRWKNQNKNAAGEEMIGVVTAMDLTARNFPISVNWGTGSIYNYAPGDLIKVITAKKP